METLRQIIDRIATDLATELAPANVYKYTRPVTLNMDECPALEVYFAGETRTSHRATDGSAQLSTPIHAVYWIAMPEAMVLGTRDETEVADFLDSVEGLMPRALGMVQKWDTADTGGEIVFVNASVGRYKGGLYGMTMELEWRRVVDATLA